MFAKHETTWAYRKRLCTISRSQLYGNTLVDCVKNYTIVVMNGKRKEYARYKTQFMKSGFVVCLYTFYMHVSVKYNQKNMLRLKCKENEFSNSL